jgi:hypothetical protein
VRSVGMLRVRGKKEAAVARKFIVIRRQSGCRAEEGLAGALARLQVPILGTSGLFLPFSPSTTFKKSLSNVFGKRGAAHIGQLKFQPNRR